MEDFGSPILKALLDQHGGAVEETHNQHSDLTVRVSKVHLREVMTFLRDTDGLEFDMLMDVTAVDYLGETPRFEVVYHLYSLAQNHRLRVKARVAEDEACIDSAIELWPSADWMEREVWDMYGIRFNGHPDPRRLLLYEEFEGHPLRKDYPKEKRQPLVGPRN